MDKDTILLLADEKLRLFEDYNRLTRQLLFEEAEPEIISIVLDERQGILDKIVSVNMDIADTLKFCQEPEYVSSLIVSYEGAEGEPREGFEELYDDGSRMKGLYEVTTRLDRKLGEKLNDMKSELKTLMTSTGKTKKVIDYFSGTTVDISKGSRFSSST